MSTRQRVIVFAIGVVLGIVLLSLLPRPDRSDRPRHPWHEQTAPEGYYPLSVEDGFGREVVVERQPRWFISLAPSVTQMLFAMDMGDHLMAVTDYCDYPEAAAEIRHMGRSIGRMDTPDLERILEFSPDIVLGSTHTDIAIFRRLHNPPRTTTLALRHDSMDDVFADIATLARVTGVPGKGARLLSELRERVADATAAVPADAAPPRVLYLLDIDSGLSPGFAPGRGAWISDLIERAGGESVTARLAQQWGTPSREALLDLAPEILIVTDGRSAGEREALRRRLERLPRHALWSEIPAVRENRIHIVDPDLFAIPGPRMPEMLEVLVQKLWQDKQRG
ncbi:MAG: ABC transporter substrate-binding protein [Opitutales bacterium]|nr:ABC transporter substrate-binding protein [Opitutales bacterium]